MLIRSLALAALLVSVAACLPTSDEAGSGDAAAPAAEVSGSASNDLPACCAEKAAAAELAAAAADECADCTDCTECVDEAPADCAGQTDCAEKTADCADQTDCAEQSECGDATECVEETECGFEGAADCKIGEAPAQKKDTGGTPE